MKNSVLNFKTLHFNNPCKQLDTSGYYVFKNSLNITQNVEPKYSNECVHVYEDTDLLMQNYNPMESSDSSDVAANFNQSNTSENAA